MKSLAQNHLIYITVIDDVNKGQKWMCKYGIIEAIELQKYFEQ